MAQYKVPQDVEADDKLLGPFSFRQFVYLLISAGLVALAFGLFQLFPLLAIIPILPTLFFLALALPLKKDQPMETYLAAIVSFYMKPHKRIWVPGQRESTIVITAPKKVEEVRTRDLSQEEATHRLSFLADIVDTGGYAIKGSSAMRDDLVAEATQAVDILDNTNYQSQTLNQAIVQDNTARREEVVNNMRQAIDNMNFQSSTAGGATPTIGRFENRSNAGSGVTGDPLKNAAQHADVIVMPEEEKKAEPKEEKKAPEPVKRNDAKPMMDLKNPPKAETEEPKPDIIELAHNADFSIATIAKEANRIKRKDDGEVFISLH